MGDFMKFNKKISCLFFLSIFLSAQYIFAENFSQEIKFNFSSLAATENQNLPFEKADSWSEKKHPFVALSGALGVNVLISTWNRYMIGSDWAKVGWDEWNHFWERKLTWDRDWYWTNFFLHPYQGSLYYMAARGSNLNKLESLAVTFLGSYTWEYLCESNAPSKNDMVFTTIGSFCVGEMFFRLSAEADEISKFLSYAINPQRIWTQSVWKIKQKRGGNNIHSLSLGFDIGNIVANTKVNNMDSSLYPEREIYPVFSMFEFNVVYNDPFTHDSNSPYSQFDLYVHGGIGKGSGKAGYCAYENIDEKLFYDIRIFSDGMLFARNLNLLENTESSLGAVMIYDFEWHSYYMLSSLAPGFAFKQRVNLPDAKLEWQAMLAGILLGNTDYYYFHRKLTPVFDVSCNYNNTIGGETILKFHYKKENGFDAGLDFRGYAMYDFYDQLQDGADTGFEFIGLLTASVQIPLSKTVRIGLKDELYGKVTSYKKIDDVKQLVNTGRFFCKFELK